MGGSFIRLGARATISLSTGGALQMGGVLFKQGLLISASEIFDWSHYSPASGEADILSFIDSHEAVRGDFLLLGTGAALVFPSPSFGARIDQRGMGLEVMDSAAACLTYNLLLSEGRLFTAALLPL